MKERRQKEEAHRSAVSGKKIKLKIKKSSKDKEVNVNLIFFFHLSRWSVNWEFLFTFYNWPLYTKGRGGWRQDHAFPLMKYHWAYRNWKKRCKVSLLSRDWKIKQDTDQMQICSWKRARLNAVKLFFRFSLAAWKEPQRIASFLESDFVKRNPIEQLILRTTRQQCYW